MSQMTLSKILVIMLSAILLLSACNQSSNLANSTSPTLPPDKGPMQTITIDNTSPSNIDVGLLIKIIQPDPLQQVSVLIMGVTFYYQQSKIINFKQNEKFVCNGLSFPMDSKNSEVTNNIPAPGTVMNCTYSSPQGKLSYSFAIPEQPKILSPSANTTIIPSAQVPMTISIAPTCKQLGIDINYESSNNQYSGIGFDSSSGCVAQQSLNLINNPNSPGLKITAGPGTLGINEWERLTDVTLNPGFHSFEMTIESEATIPVTWQ